MSVTNARTTDEYIDELKAKLRKNAECGNTHYMLGQAYLAKRMFHEAENSFQEAVRCSPKLAEAYVQLGGVAMQRGDLDSAFSYNKMANDIRPAFSVPFANMGFIKLQKGDVEGAIFLLRKAVGKDPDFIQAHSTLGSAYYAQGDLVEAEKHLTKALELEPRFGPAYNNLALIALDKGDKAKARELLAEAQKWGFDVHPELLKQVAE